MTTRSRRGRVLVAVAVVAAVVVAALTGLYPYAALTPSAPAATVRLGQSVELAGVRYRLQTFVAAPSLPADDPDDPPREGPEGSVLVLVVVTQTVLDHRIVLDDVFCDVSLVDAAGAAEWDVDTDASGLVARPDAHSCAASDDAPLRYDEPRDIGFSFKVPAAAAQGSSVRLRVRDGPTLALAP